MSGDELGNKNKKPVDIYKNNETSEVSCGKEKQETKLSFLNVVLRADGSTRFFLLIPVPSKTCRGRESAMFKFSCARRPSTAMNARTRFNGAPRATIFRTFLGESEVSAYGCPPLPPYDGPQRRLYELSEPIQHRDSNP